MANLCPSEQRVFNAKEGRATHYTHLLAHPEHGQDGLDKTGDSSFAGRLGRSAQGDELGERVGKLFEEQLLVRHVLLHHLAELCRTNTRGETRMSKRSS